ncbi:MAG: DUF1361 domain-containing protein [Bacteroidia bacterium]|nr:DUF1361 domain-containing protein [Bacteroidia bacterium]
MWRKHIVQLIIFCVLLVLIRLLKTGEFTFTFLYWNLFLALVPYLLIRKYDDATLPGQKLVLVLGSILFLPNAPYMLTDLFHLRKNMAAPQWYDLILILSFALLGLILFVMTTARLLRIFENNFKHKTTVTALKIWLFLANGYGIYLGRYLRLNSWDLVSQPDNLFKLMYNSVFDAYYCRETLAITFTFTIFLYLIFGIYESLKHHVTQQPHQLP